MMMIWSQPAAMASSTPYWMIGLSTSGSISLGCALVAGKKRVPRPAAGNTALRTLIVIYIPGLRSKPDKLTQRQTVLGTQRAGHYDKSRRRGRGLCEHGRRRLHPELLAQADE